MSRNDERRVHELLSADRELTEEEQEFLNNYTRHVWNGLSYAIGVTSERRRLRELWLALEAASGEAYLEKLEAFRAALDVR